MSAVTSVLAETVIVFGLSKSMPNRVLTGSLERHAGDGLVLSSLLQKAGP